MIAECVFKIIEHKYTSRYGKYAWGHYTYQNVEWDFSIWALGSTVEPNRPKKKKFSNYKGNHQQLGPGSLIPGLQECGIFNKPLEPAFGKGTLSISLCLNKNLSLFIIFSGGHKVLIFFFFLMSESLSDSYLPTNRAGYTVTFTAYCVPPKTQMS